ncbi:LTA synthase family protein [Janthinobacterium sp. 17J80-10]|uniref:LTA synthase family protein n=1 Tax=Janthinobacterium sp. 17J80-10 TaxID=2497863 RepID=UPI0010059DEC|nr:LTA synthase family protein [Janthinobacterium sp. 17J80-10]QAU33134.1 LTA synthase family protein [Janthinobacterium sp. 17J80-10]
MSGNSSGWRARAHHYFGAVPLLLLATFLAASLLTRIGLLALSWREVDWLMLPASFLLGILYDLIAGAWSLVPVLLIYLVLPQRRIPRAMLQGIVLALLGTSIYLLLFNFVSELLFWQEFGVRYNFIAVDYLVYTTEVIGNIRESYPVGKILAGLLVLTLLLLWPARRLVAAALAQPQPVRARLRHAAGWAMILVATWFGAAAASAANGFANHYNVELASNGLYSFAAAFRNNELDYEHFYLTRPSNEVRQTLGRMLASPGAEPDKPRQVAAHGAEQRLNVVLVSVESLSADFLGKFGNNEGLTPQLDRLASQGLLFTKLYATGTRTVRGLEALTLSVPPTPGQSIVKRPGNEDLFSLGSVFRGKGYDVRYAYGGYGYFDNMNAFFGGNNYNVVDRLNIPDSRIPFENIWGVADEALFDQVLDEIDASHRQGRLSFTHVMTTSNHRPFTYPDGRIDIPSHTGRAGGVKYTDYAIGRFIDMARAKPWFKDTMFVIVADHTASSAGKTDLPVARYHIPMIVYAPAHVKPGTVDRLASQIDTGPTLLGMLNFSYASRFIGHDVLHTPPEDDRAFISTYQSLGYLKHDTLTVLQPRRQVAAFAVDAESNTTPVPVNQTLVQEAVAYYQGTAELVKAGQYRSLR